jgi:ankyrin repeat protein
MKGRMIITLMLSVALAGAAGRAAAQSMTTVAMAASRNETAQVQALLEDKFNDPDIIDGQSGRTALDFAASFNNQTMAQLLLDHGAHVDWRDTMGNSALHYAAERSNLDVLRFLIEHGATVDFANKQGITPIMVAAEHAQPAAVRLLLKSGADPKKQDFTGRDAYGWAGGKPAVVQALNTAR